MRENGISEWLQSEYLTYFALMQIIQYAMIITISISVFITGAEAYAIHPNEEFSVVFAKAACSGALHIMLYPFLERSMTLIKYTNNHPSKFTNPNVAEYMCLSMFMIALLAELINVYLLTY